MPNAADSHAFIEVSDMTYADDKKTKIPLHVAARVPTWHVSIPARRVEFYDVGADPQAPRLFAEDETLEILQVKMPVASLFETR